MNKNDIINLGYGFAIGNNLDVNETDGKKERNIYWQAGWFNKPIDNTLILNIKNRGFKTVKLPISWQDHIEFDLENNKCICEKWWIEMCKDTIQMVLDNDLYCIINTQHDADWLSYYNPYNDNENILKKFELLWRMIAESFKDFDSDKLIYEDYNELGDNNGYLFNAFSKAFINAVRDVDENDNRLLLLDGNWSDPKATYELENIDIDDNNYALALHFYKPANFTISEVVLGRMSYPKKINESLGYAEVQDYDYGEKESYIDKYGGEVLVDRFDENIVKEHLDYITKIKDKFNIPVVISEFGCSTFYRDKDDVYDWFKLVTLFCQENKIPLVMWNNGNDYQCMKRTDNLNDRLSVDMEKIITYYNNTIFGEDLLNEYKSDYPDIIRDKDYEVDPIILDKYGLVPKSAIYGISKEDNDK